MDRPIAAAAVLGILLLLLGLMWLGWRSLRRRSSGIPAPQPIPAAGLPDAGAELLSRDGWYVATTRAGKPLDRVAVHGLAFRARAGIRVTTAGIELRLSGGTECFVPASALRVVERATWTIDRAVETGGLVVVGWTLGAVSDSAVPGSSVPDSAVPDSSVPDSAVPDSTLPGSAVDVDTYLRVDDPASLVEAILPLIPVPHGRTLA